MSTILITGSNRGIGLEMCRQLAARGDDVIATCRSSNDELEALDVRVETGVDVTSDESVRGLAERLEGTTLDVLINNAGLLRMDAFGRVDFDAVREQLEINALGPLRVTETLAPLLRDGGKVAILTSRMGSIADNGSGGSYGYRMSKAAVNMVGKSLSRDLAGRGIAVALLHPGFVRTQMTGGMGNIDPPESARGLIARIDALNVETSGGFWHANGEVLPW